jgi:hypothetical protein
MDGQVLPLITVNIMTPLIGRTNLSTRKIRFRIEKLTMNSAEL